jgi:beta-1,4-mannosyltransferase
MSSSAPPAEGALRRRRIVVVVVGDLGRSPRMQFHALALAAEGAEVELVGLAGAALVPELAANRRVHATYLAPATGGIRSPYGLWLTARGLARAIENAGDYDLLLVQNPPPLPSLRVVARAARRRGVPWIVDWHNLGFAMLALRSSRPSPSVALLRELEGASARAANAHFCVTAALRHDLARRWGLEATVLYDRPAPWLAGARIGAPGLRARLAERLGLPDLATGGRLLVVSPTSWTADEDFDLLLEALRGFAPTSPLLVAISGRGERRAAFEARAAPLLAATEESAVALRTMWLEPDEYPSFLAAADLGLCLHRSASGLDLPMKLADFRGAGVPALVLDYGPVLRERFTPGREGWLFADAAELRDRLSARLDPAGRSELRRIAATLRDAAQPPRDFVAGWRDEALPLVLRLVARGER